MSLDGSSKAADNPNKQREIDMEKILVAMTAWWPAIETFLKIVPGVVLLPITAALAFRKLSHRAEIVYSWSWSIDSAERVSWMLIRNLKEKPLEVCAIHAVIHKDVRIELYRAMPPLIIKSMECAEISPDPVSYYEVFGYQTANIGISDITDFYITTADRVIRAKGARMPESLEREYFGDPRVLKPVRNEHNGRIYSPDAAFALDFVVEGESRTAIALRNGAVVGGSPLGRMQLEPEEAASEEVLRAIVEENFPEVSDLVIVSLKHHWIERMKELAEDRHWSPSKRRNLSS